MNLAQTTEAPLPVKFEELEKVRPWIQAIIMAWDSGENQEYVEEVLTLIFGASVHPSRPSEEDLERVRLHIIDTVIRWARDSDLCDNDYVIRALAEVFPEPSGGYRDSDGFTCYGHGPDGFNDDGYDEDGYGRDGFDDEGYDKHGYGRDGFHRYHKTNRQGLNREEWAKTPAGVAAYVKGLGPEFIAAVRDALSAPVNTATTE